MSHSSTSRTLRSGTLHSVTPTLTVGWRKLANLAEQLSVGESRVMERTWYTATKESNSKWTLVFNLPTLGQHGPHMESYSLWLEKSFPRAHQPERFFFTPPKWKTEKDGSRPREKGVGMLVSPHHFRHGGGEIREGGVKVISLRHLVERERQNIYPCFSL